MYCEKLVDDEDGLTIKLSGELSKANISINFGSVFAYQNIDESYRLETIGMIEDEIKNSIIIVKDSSWLKWFHMESCNIYVDNGISHYLIYTSNDLIDVLSSEEPNVF